LSEDDPHGGPFEGTKDWLRINLLHPSMSVLPGRSMVEPAAPKAPQQSEVGSDG
jgi:hypothetical protein